VYGKPVELPVKESHPLDPQSIYAIHKKTAEYYYLLYSRLYKMNAVIFRISNPYGYNYHPEEKSYSILNQFIYKAIRGEQIQLYGDGTQKRDYLHIKDLSSLFLETIHNERMTGQIFNVGYGTGYSMRHVVETIQKIIPGTTYRFVDWPLLEKNIETGDYFSDLSKLSSVTEWTPTIDLETGIRMTANAYKIQQDGQ
jgi:nucleoside-diphosphate-sugar epimerase